MKRLLSLLAVVFAFGLTTVAMDAEAAKRMGVDFVQGYQLGRPQPMNRVAAKAV